MDTTTAPVEKTAKPQWLRVKLPTGKKYTELRSLVDKYQLKRETCYYIGDRPLDVDVAINSGIQSINFCDYKPAYNQKIEHLKDIKNLFYKSKNLS